MVGVVQAVVMGSDACIKDSGFLGILMIQISFVSTSVEAMAL